MTVPTLLEPDEVRRALFVRLKRFGDTIFLAHAIGAFKAWAPHAHLGVVVKPGYDALIRLLPEVDEIVFAEPGARGAVRSWRRVRAFDADLAVDFHGGPRAAGLMAACRAPIRVGEKRFRWPVYDVRIDHAEHVYGLERRSHTIENHLALLAGIGVPTPPRPVSLPVDPRARESVEHRLRFIGDSDPVVLFPTTTLRAKQWPIERWAALAHRLADQRSGKILLQFGPGEDELAEFCRSHAGAAHVFDDFSIGELNALVAGAQLVVGQDSLGVHLAAAHATPSVVLYGGTDPASYFPWMSEHVVLRVDGLVCSPCEGRDCRSPYYRWACIDEIDDEVVYDIVAAWLDGDRPGARRLPIER